MDSPPAPRLPVLASALSRLTESRRRPAPSTLARAARSGLTFTATALGDIRVLTFYGVLDDTTSTRVHDGVLKAALGQYRALIIDVTRLAARTPSAWSVFITARSHIAARSDTPMALVCGTISGQKALRRSGISDDIPVHWRIKAAINAAPDDDEYADRRRAHAELPSQSSSSGLEHWPTIPLRKVPDGPSVYPASSTSKPSFRH